MSTKANLGIPVQISGRSGTPICLPLGTSGATGFQWHLALPPEVQRIEDLGIADVAAGKTTEYQAGEGPRYQAQVVAPEGVYLIHAKLARAWDLDHPIQELEIELTVTK